MKKSKKSKEKKSKSNNSKAIEFNLNVLWIVAVLFLASLLYLKDKNQDEKNSIQQTSSTEMNQSKSDFENLIRDLENKKEDLEKTLEAKKLKIQEVKNEIDRSTENRTVLDKEVQRIEEVVDELKEDIEQSSIFPDLELKRLQMKIVEKKSDVAMLKSLVDGNDKTIEDLQSRIADYKNQINNLRIQLTSKESEIEVLKRDSKDLQDEISGIELITKKSNDNFTLEKKELIKIFNQRNLDNDEQESYRLERRAIKKANKRVELILDELNQVSTACISSYNFCCDI